MREHGGAPDRSASSSDRDGDRLTGDRLTGDRLAEDRLAIEARGGDPRALATLYRRFAPALLAYLARLLGNRADAEDVLHESFLKVFEGHGRYDGRGRFRPWLFTIATRLAHDRHRRAGRRDRLLPEATTRARPAGTVDPLERVAHRELERRIESVLAGLPPSYAAAFHLRVREGLSYREIAAVSGEPEGTLRSRVHHTLRRLRAHLAGPGEAAATSDRGEAATTSDRGEAPREERG
jgi:RNA polymerase sigma-70 factor (ECF subfamily)